MHSRSGISLRLAPIWTGRRNVGQNTDTALYRGIRRRLLGGSQVSLQYTIANVFRKSGLTVHGLFNRSPVSSLLLGLCFEAMPESWIGKGDIREA